MHQNRWSVQTFTGSFEEYLFVLKISTVVFVFVVFVCFRIWTMLSELPQLKQLNISNTQFSEADQRYFTFFFTTLNSFVICHL